MPCAKNWCNSFQAYYIIEVISAIRKDDSVMITNADSNIGLACIAVALQHTKDIWAIVKTKEAKQMLSKKFEQVRYLQFQTIAMSNLE